MAILEKARLEMDRMSLSTSPIDHATLREAVFLLLERADRRLEPVSLLTMVGLADHLMIAKVGTPVSGDDYFMLPNGPMPIRLFEELREARISGSLWQDRVAATDTHLELVGSSECRRLSRGLRKVLDAAFDAVHQKGLNEVVESMAEACPEWLGKGFRFVPLAEVYAAFGASPEDAAAQVADVRSYYARRSGPGAK